jgi:DNA-binding transcriptional LysR family regulator
MVRDELSVLSAFFAVAEERSFTRAAKQLGVSPSALSHAIRGLEERLGVRLLARTTRSVAPTEAGEQFLARLGPALADVRGALDQVTGLRDQPAGRVRLVASRLAARCINFRHGSSGVYHWEFDKGRKSLSVAVSGPLTADDGDILLRAAVDGVGLAFALEEHVATELAKGTLVPVLEDWCPPFAGYFLYYPGRRQQPPALSALIEALRL